MKATTVSTRAAFFTGLRHQIEHRYERDIATLVAGRTQAYVLNYEKTLVELFGEEEALADELRFPLFLSAITGGAVASVKKLRERIPKGVIEWVQDFDTSVQAGITSDQRFDFKVYLIPYKGSKTDADAAMTFVREDELTDEQRSVMDQVRTIIREKKVPVGGSDEFLPGQVMKSRLRPRSTGISRCTCILRHGDISVCVLHPTHLISTTPRVNSVI